MRALAVVAICALVSACPARGDARSVREVDVAKSKASFVVTHLYVEHVSGSLPIRSATATFEDGATVPWAVEATLDARRIATDDADRDDDLQGPDWFDTQRFPTWRFVSTGVTPTAGGFTVNGELTIHGASQPVALAATKVGDRYHVVGSVDRHAFGMRKTPMDGLIGSDVTIVLDIALR